MKRLHQGMPFSRAEHLASIYQMDQQIKKLIETSETLDRETIFIFQSDNGAASHYWGPIAGQKKWGETVAPRGCNYPYKGYKDTLYEGGTISPSFIYSTKQRYQKPKVADMFHIIDWFPTILDLAGYPTENLPTNLDGVSQRAVLDLEEYTPPRTAFIYGVLNFFDKCK